MIETADVRLVFVDPSESFLVPHAVRTFLNSLEFQQRLFDFDPDEPMTVLLADFSDSGNAGATSARQRSRISRDRAPQLRVRNDRRQRADEHHHEPRAGARGDDGPGGEAGSVLPAAVRRQSVAGRRSSPSRSLYFFLTTPRVAAPRWYHEGIAMFVDTWMAGGLGRAQSGYDEMVFRSMVRDGAPFYDPLGLVSEGTQDRLSARDQLLPVRHALHDLAGAPLLARSKLDRVGRRAATAAARYYASQFRQVFGADARTGVESRGSRTSSAFQQENLDAIRKFPITPHGI